MQYFGIKTPLENNYTPSYIWWIANSEHGAWQQFFQYPNKNGEFNAHRAPLADAIRAYEGIGYKCVEVDVIEKVSLTI